MEGSFQTFLECDCAHYSGIHLRDNPGRTVGLARVLVWMVHHRSPILGIEINVAKGGVISMVKGAVFVIVGMLLVFAVGLIMDKLMARK